MIRDWTKKAKARYERKPNDVARLCSENGPSGLILLKYTDR